MMREIELKLNDSRTIDEKIVYLKGLRDKDKRHFILYTLASLYLEQGETKKSESMLKEDLNINKDLCDAYESYSLLVGMYIDQKREVSDMEVNRFTHLFHKMKKNADKQLLSLDKAIGKIKGKKDSIDAVTAQEMVEELEDRKKKIHVCIKDPFQFERMMGDYYYSGNNTDKAYALYESYYEDLDRPIEIFTPDSMRNYVDLLLRKNKPDRALIFMGYIINIKPYMLDDVIYFSEIYYQLNEKISAVLTLLFALALSDGYSNTHHEKVCELIERMTSEMQGLEGSQKILNLTDIYLKSENILDIQLIMDGLRKEGVKNFFFSYLEGIYFFTVKDYQSALGKFLEFNEIYPYLADSYCYAMLSMYSLDAVKHSKEIVTAAEKAIELKPDSEVAKITKRYLGTMVGLNEDESQKLLTSYEIGSILNNYLFHDGSVHSLDKLLTSLTIRKNPYQMALVELMSKVSRRKKEFVAYLKNMYDLFNKKGKENIKIILAGMDESPD